MNYDDDEEWEAVFLDHDDEGVEDFVLRDQVQLFRHGSARFGAISSRRRGGNRCCMGRCGFCSGLGYGVKKSMNRIRKFEEGWNKNNVQIDTAFGRRKAAKIIRFKDYTYN